MIIIILNVFLFLIYTLSKKIYHKVEFIDIILYFLTIK